MTEIVSPFFPGVDRIDRACPGCDSRSVAGTVDSLFDLYAARYSEGDLQGVASLCVTPFFAVRKGEVIFMPDRGAVVSHFAASIDAYRRASGAQTWSPREIVTRELGAYSAFVTVNWNALDADGQVVRDTWTSYQVLTTPGGWRFLSYTNHF